MLKKIISIIIIVVALAVVAFDIGRFTKKVKADKDDNGTETGDTVRTLTDGSFTYEINQKEELTLIRYSGRDENVVIPDNVSGRPVTGIGVLAFNSVKTIKSLSIPATVRRIDKMAFFSCSAIKKIIIPSGVEEIGSSAFRNCTSVESISFDDAGALKSIGDFAFASCKKISSLEFPDGLKYVGEGAFSNCIKLRSVVTDRALEEIGAAAFSGCVELNTLTIDSDACLIFGSKEKPAFHDCKSIEKIIFSDNVKTIGSYMASGLGNLTSIEFPKALERIENSAFYGCIGLTSLRFPDTLEYVGENAFFGCLALSTFNEPSKLYEIGSGAFENTAWYNMQEDGMIYFGKTLFGFKGEITTGSTAVVQEGTVSIASGAFADTSGALTTITLPSSLERIGHDAFSHCRASIIWADMSGSAALEEIGERAFADYGGSIISIPASVRKICEYAFSGSRAEVDFSAGTSLTTIGKHAFADYIGPTITIPASVTEIGDSAFSGISCTINFSDGSALMELGYGAFANYKGYNLKIPDSVVSVGIDCFFSSSANVIFSENSALKVINADAFRSYEGSILVFPVALEKIDQAAFNDCYSISIIGYYGSEEQWKNIGIAGGTFDDLDYVEFEYDFDYNKYFEIGE